MQVGYLFTNHVHKIFGHEWTLRHSYRTVSNCPSCLVRRYLSDLQVCPLRIVCPTSSERIIVSKSLSSTHIITETNLVSCQANRKKRVLVKILTNKNILLMYLLMEADPFGSDDFQMSRKVSQSFEELPKFIYMLDQQIV